jgi:hypothetical protein
LVTRVPPYEYQWTWSSAVGDTESYSLSASAANGQMSSSMAGSPQLGGAFGSIDQICSVGIFFRPPTRNGLLTFSSTPSFTARYGIIALIALLRTESWIGLYAEQYNVSDNSFAGAIIDQRSNRVFNLDAFYFYNVAGRNFSNSGFPLSAMIPVDSAHWYSIWFQCGGHASAAGVRAYASSNIDLTVPSITWSYSSIVG